MIFHLLKTDWNRLRFPILAVWFVILLCTLPWLLHDPASFDVPMSSENFMSGNLEALGLTIRSPYYGGLFNFLVRAATLLLSTAIGMHDLRWQAVSPIRPGQRLAAKALALLLFIVLPQLVVGAAILILHGFSLSFTVISAAGIGLSLMLLHGIAAVFGRCCGSFWPWSAALTCLVGLLSLLDFGARDYGVFLDPWANSSSPLLWTRMAVSLLLVACLPRILLARPGRLASITAATVGICASYYLTQLPVFRTLLQARHIESGVVMDSIQPKLAPEGVQVMTELRSEFGRTSFVNKPGGRIETTGQRPGTFVHWHAGNLPPEPALRVLHDEYSTAKQEAIYDALPAPLVDRPSLRDALIDLTPGGPSTRKFQPATVTLTGLAFRYLTLADLPLGEGRFATGRDEITLAARLRDGKGLGPLTELSLQYPSQFLIGDTALFDYFLYLPKDSICIKLSPILSQTAPLPGGAIRLRLILATVNGFRPDPEAMKSARLVVLQPEFLGSFRRNLTIPPVSEITGEETADWTMARRYGLSKSAYFSMYRPQRPDPATCSEKEFARYLRAIGTVFPWEIVERDLAEYAPRFPRILALHAQRNPAAAAVESGVPESLKAEVLATVDGPMQAFRLASTLTDRQWQIDAREPLLACLDPPFMFQHSGNISPVVTAIAGLEDS